MTRLSILMLLISTASAQGLCAFGANTQFKTDFSGGIPKELVLIDRDMNTPTTAMANIGFAPGIPWIGYYIEDEDEYVACSTSWYKPTGTSDDWMILPKIHVEEGATLCWRARCSDKKYFDGYAVYISQVNADNEDTNSFDADSFDAETFNPELFQLENPLFSIAQESNTWQNYEFSLSEYEGQDIHIAFVNNSTNKAKLYIDDIKAGTDRPLVLTLDVPALVRDQENGTDITVKGFISSELADLSQLGNITLTYAGETLTVSNEELVNAGSHVPFEFSSAMHLDAGGDAVIEVVGSSENGFSTSISQKVWSTYRPVVVEEFTGTWCAWCVRGIVYMELLKEHYGDMMIPLCVHEFDVMEVEDYFGTVDYLKEEAIPNAIVNRKYESDPAQLYSCCEQALTEDIRATFTSFSATCSEENSPVEVSASVAFSNSETGDYSLAYVLVEDKICVDMDINYCQKNAYSGGAAGAMGGFENMPSVILSNDIAYRDVVRYVSEGGSHGVKGSLPGAPKPGEEYSHQYSIEIPDFIFNQAELSLVAMIVDNRSGEVLNARSMPLAEVLPGVNGITDIYTDTDALNGEVDVYSISAVHIGHFPSKESFRNSSPTNGLYILKDANGQSQKIICR